ncbi:MAG: 2-oxoacid:acceptor oxidoreductase subunit alpha [Verrucomicrobiae bacterium]|jgi:2-oxoglutarate ferredoxin oxidoreductase subunit alpha|nr:2-oxoacid:acceptor oxidoreductase subunit alpha [Verrucomicrobiae bacterium]
MSDSTTTAPDSSGKKVSKITEAVIRIAGNSQDGIQAIGGFLARLAGRSEQDVMTFMTIPSTISGGPSIFQVRIGTGEILSSGDEADVLLAFYQHSYEGHIGSLRKGGIVVYDSDHVEPNDAYRGDYQHIGVGISSLAIEAIGGSARDKGKNIFALGLIARMFDLNVEKLKKLITERFLGKPENITNNALLAFSAGYAYDVGDLADLFSFHEADGSLSNQVVMNGNEALGYGLITAGVRFGAGYPITPWSDIMELLRRELPKYGGSFVQCEDEIASVSTAIGASYASGVAVTGSSGPGIALKSEAIGWAVMAEIPLVVVNVQRGGPSTGMPTNVEQSDLFIACFGGHGDSPRVVLAPSDVEDAFYMAIEAVNIARKYSVPVFILSDQAIATRIEAFPEPNLKELMQDITPDRSPVADHKPYDLSPEDGITRHIVPGTRVASGKYPVVTGLEHDELGHPTGSKQLHIDMTAKRRKKLLSLRATLPKTEPYGPAEGDVLLVGWGSSKGPIREAVDRMRKAGENVSAVHVRYLNPLPNDLGEIMKGFKHVLVVELNDQGFNGYGQMGTLLRAKHTESKIRGITKTDGLTWRVSEIVERVHAAVENAG